MAMPTQAFDMVRSERRMMERLVFDLPFRRFVRLGSDDPVGTKPPSSRTATARRGRRRDRLPAGPPRPAAPEAPPLDQAFQRGRHADRGGDVDEELKAQGGGGPEAAALAPGGPNGESDVRGRNRSNETHVSMTDPDAKLYPRGSRRGPGSPSSAKR